MRKHARNPQTLKTVRTRDCLIKHEAKKGDSGLLIPRETDRTSDRFVPTLLGYRLLCLHNVTQRCTFKMAIVAKTNSSAAEVLYGRSLSAHDIAGG